MADGTIIEVKPHFRTRLKALGFGTELQRSFDLENVPRNQIDKAWHVLIGPVAGLGQNHTDQQMSVDTLVTVFLKGFRDEDNATIEAYEKGELIVADLCSAKSPNSRVAIPCLKNIEFISMVAEPFDDSNDNIVRLLINFEVLLILDLATA